MAKRPQPTGQQEPKPKPPASKKSDGEKIIVENRKARHDYHILETIEVGMALLGTEVKSLREHKVVVGDAYAAITRGGELMLYNAAIQPYTHGNVHNHEERRARKLLAHKHEIAKLAGKVQEKGLTLIVLKLYFKNGRAKALLGLGKGKKEYDRRDDIKRRQDDREAQRAMRRNR